MNAIPLRRPADDTPDGTKPAAVVVPRCLPPVQDGNASGYASRIPGIMITLPERLAALSGESLLHASPPPVATVWARHQEAAQRWEAGLVRWPRHAWGVMHTAGTALAYLFIAVAFSPAGFTLALLLIAACWLWL